MGRCEDSVPTGAPRGPRAADGAGEGAGHLRVASLDGRTMGPTIAWLGQRPWQPSPSATSHARCAAAKKCMRMPIWSGFRRFYYELILHTTSFCTNRSTSHPTESPLVTLSLRRTYLVPRRWRRACYLLRRQVGRGGGRGPPFITA